MEETATVSRERQKAEALERMQMLDLAPEIVEAFEKNGTLHVCNEPNGSYFAATDEVLRVVRHIEQQFDALVFLIVRSTAIFGVMDSLLFVSRYTEEWAEDREDIADGYAMTYTKNWTDDNCSEFGSIAFTKHPGVGITRAW